MYYNRSYRNTFLFWTTSGVILFVIFVLMVIATRKRQLRMAQDEYIFVKLFQEELNIDINEIGDFGTKHDLIDGMREEMNHMIG